MLNIMKQNFKLDIILTHNLLYNLFETLKTLSQAMVSQFVQIMKCNLNLDKFAKDISEQVNKLFTESYSIFRGWQENVNFNVFEKPTATMQLNWRQLQKQQIKEIKLVKHSNTGRMAYEGVLLDGNKVLFHDINSKPGDLTFILKNKKGESQPGYTDQWIQQGESIKTNNLNVQEVQMSVKGKNLTNEKFNLKNFEYSKSQYYATTGAAIGSMIGSIVFDCATDGFNFTQISKNLTIGGLILAASAKAPTVGMYCQGLLAIYQIGCICNDQTLTSAESAQQILQETAKTGFAIASFWAGVQQGFQIGSYFGPYGAITGGIIGGFLSGMGSKQFSKSVDDYYQFNIDVKILQENKSVVDKGFLIDFGINPEVQIQNVKEKCKSLVLVAATENCICWVIVNLKPSTTKIEKNSGLGRKNFGRTYIGPSSQHKQITFTMFGLEKEFIDENIDIKNLEKEKFMCVAKKIILLQ